MARVVKVWGMSPEELSNLSHERFMELVDSRARRALRRLDQNPQFRRLIEKAKKVKEAGGKKVIKTHVREAVILPWWIGLKFGVHNGKEFVEVEIKPEMVGKRLGEFAHTTKRVMHSGPGVGATRSSKFVPLK